MLRSLLLPRSTRSMSSTCLCRISTLDVRTLAPLSLSARSVNRCTSTSRLSWVTSSAEMSERESVSSVSVSLALSSSASAGSTSILMGPEFLRSTESWLEWLAPGASCSSAARGECGKREEPRLDEEKRGRNGEKGEM